MMGSKPVIGVLPLVDIGRDSFWILPGYFQGVEKAGGLPIMLPLTDVEDSICQIVDCCDGFLFTGGQDVSPELYREQVLNETVETNPARDRMELLLLKKAMEADKPILGICRGIQLINVALGGTLYQDLPTQHESKINHHQSPPYDRPAHKNKISPETPLYDLLRKEEIAVNSYHHQAIKDLATPLTAMALSEDGLIEAVYKPNQKFIWAVQWHPEFSFGAEIVSRQIFEAFISICTMTV